MKRLIVIAFVIVLLLGGGGAAVYFFSGADDFISGSMNEKRAASGPTLLELDNLVIPVIRDRRVERHVVLRVTLEMRDGAARDEAVRIQPRLRDALIRDLHDYYSYVLAQEEVLDLAALGHRVRRASDRVVGAGKVRNALVQGAVERAAGAD